ncbi:Crp/Fnr family transcriptional regulator [Marinicrinis lubricantis]|uniref:Crp/Fnr family transcriptional regulator n=1 Tax=Marinicrinis lubricantis TaxID=2086470 RepID=A0ABW1IQJ6_9BACL
MAVEQPSFVRNTSYFSKSNLEKLTDIMYEHKIHAGAYLYQEGEPAKKLYYVKQGTVKLTKSTPDGKEFILHLFQKGDLLGQIDGHSDAYHQFNAIAMEGCVVGIIQMRDLEVLLWQFGELSVEFMKWMGTIQRMTETKFRDLILFGKPGALCSTLIRLYHTYGMSADNNMLISKKLTNSDLAEMIGSTRESVNRMLNDLKHRDVISMDAGYITIKDIDYLKDTCHCENCPLDICRI